ncbi:MAG: polysaccharide biosynthesis protein [Eubacterium sp.]|nr:polysaccharide biosynthesis protein [Eubacterium sp.]
MKQKNTLVKNASILMIASIISRVIGLLYRRPLGATLGSVGMGYYGVASNLYSILLLISSYSIPMAISKIVSEKNALGQYRNAHKTFLGAMIYAVIVGGVTALICWFGGRFLLPANQPNALPALRALAPTIFLSAILGVFRGYFQAHKSMTPTSISQILEQIMNALVSVIAAVVLIRTMAPEGGANAAIFGAMGGTIGTGAGVAVGLIFMLYVFRINRGFFRRRRKRDIHSTEESYGDIFKDIILMITPIIFTSFIYNCSAYLNTYVYSSIQGLHGIDSELIMAAYGEYSNYYIPMIGIPLALASAGTSAMMPEVSESYAVGDRREVNRKSNETIRLSMFVCIPCMIGLTVLAYPIMGVLFPASSDLAAKLLMFGSIFVVTDSFSIVTGGVLQSIGQQKTALINSAVSLGVNMASLALLLALFPQLDVYAVMISNILFTVVCCVLNTLSLRKYLRFRMEIRKTYIEPLIASAVMGAVAFALYSLIASVTKRPSIGLFVSIIAAIFVYLIIYVKISHTGEAEMRKYPMGGMAVRVLKKIRVYR